MSKTEILALYDAEERRDIKYFDARREASSRIVRHTSRFGGRGFIIHWDLVGTDVEAAVREQIAYFAAIGQDFEWKVYSHDSPAELGELLIGLGFEPEPEETIVYLDLTALPAHLTASSTANVERVVDPRGVDEIIAMMKSVWNEDFPDLAASLKAELKEAADHLGIYAARMNGVLASAAWIRFHDKSRFAGLWGGTTIPAFRNRGLYSALVAARAAEASRRSVRYVTVDALPTSRPILDKLGFQALTCARGYIWKVPTKAANR